MPNCQNCQEKCPQAELAHEAAKGRMYATKEFIALLKKVESGQLVEVVRCKDCQKCLIDNAKRELHLCMKRPSFPVRVKLDGFCSDGERKDLAAVAEELNWLQKPAEE